MTDYQRERERSERRNQAEAKLSSLSPRTRAQFCDEVLVNLLDAGWSEERVWDAVELHEFENRFAAAYPICVHEALLKFGGITIGIDGRSIRVGSIVEYKYIFPDLPEQVVTTRLYLIGETDILCDDALGVMMDDAGHVYVDGSTSDDPPKDYSVGRVSSNFIGFLNAMFSDALGILEKTDWKYYSALDGKPNGGADGNPH
jgi:hypothetical protein